MSTWQLDTSLISLCLCEAFRLSEEDISGKLWLEHCNGQWFAWWLPPSDLPYIPFSWASRFSNIGCTDVEILIGLPVLKTSFIINWVVSTYVLELHDRGNEQVGLKVDEDLKVMVHPFFFPQTDGDDHW